MTATGAVICAAAGRGIVIALSSSPVGSTVVAAVRTGIPIICSVRAISRLNGTR